MKFTHYIPPFTQRHGRGIHEEFKAACGQWVADEQHSTEPNCEACKAWLEEDESGVDLEELRKPPTNPVPPRDFDVHEGYRLRGVR